MAGSRIRHDAGTPHLHQILPGLGGPVNRSPPPFFMTMRRAEKFQIPHCQCLNDFVLFPPCRGAVRDARCKSNPKRGLERAIDVLAPDAIESVCLFRRCVARGYVNAANAILGRVLVVNRILLATPIHVANTFIHLATKGRRTLYGSPCRRTQREGRP